MATVTNRYITVLGPIKMEILHLTSVTTADTVVSQLTNPKFGLAVFNTAAGAATSTTSVAISGRTLTFASSDFAGTATVEALIFGF